MNTFGERLLKLRKEKGYTQNQISNILGISQNAYSGYENNKHIPEIDIIIKLADIYLTSTDYLLGRYTIEQK